MQRRQLIELTSFFYVGVKKYPWLYLGQRQVRQGLKVIARFPKGNLKPSIYLVWMLPVPEDTRTESIIWRLNFVPLGKRDEVLDQFGLRLLGFASSCDGKNAKAECSKC